MDELKQARKSSGLTIEKFAESLGLPLQAYKDIEYGKSKPPLWLRRMMNAE